MNSYGNKSITKLEVERTFRTLQPDDKAVGLDGISH